MPGKIPSSYLYCLSVSGKKRELVLEIEGVKRISQVTVGENGVAANGCLNWLEQ